MKILSLVCAIVLFLSESSWARVFDINSEKFAAFFRANYGPTSIGKAAFEGASSYNETYESGLTSIQAGEFGFARASRYLSFRFAIEVVRPPSLKEISATDASAVRLYTLNSDISAVIPKFGFEFNIKQWRASRMFINTSMGQASLVLSNAYTFTTDGTTLTGVTDYTEEGRATASLIEAALGFESLLFDTTTFTFDIGYRSLKFSEIKHNRDAVTLSGSKVKGDSMLNTDGTARAIDLTGYYASLGFRFWIF